MSPGVVLLFSASGMIAVGALPSWLWNRSRPSNWPPLGIGALAWIIGVSLKLAWAVPTNRHVLGALRSALPSILATPISHIYIGLLTGVFECGILLLVVRRSRLRNADWSQAVASGIGKGGIEAVLLGCLVLLGAVAVLLAGDHLSPVQSATMAANASFARAITGPLERAFALLGHVFSTVLIVYAIRVKRLRWFWLSFAYLSGVDGLAAWGIDVFGREKLPMRPEFWGAFAVVTAVAVAGLLVLRRRFPPAVPSRGDVAAPVEGP